MLVTSITITKRSFKALRIIARICRTHRFEFIWADRREIAKTSGEPRFRHPLWNVLAESLDGIRFASFFNFEFDYHALAYRVKRDGKKRIARVLILNPLDLVFFSFPEKLLILWTLIRQRIPAAGNFSTICSVRARSRRLEQFYILYLSL